MEKINSTHEKKLNWLIYASLMSLCLGVYTSMTFVALSHIFMVIPLFYFLPRTHFKSWSKSQWAMLFMIIAMILSVLFNQDIADKGYAPLTKIKYYIFGLFSILPLNYWFSNLAQDEKDKKIRHLLNAIFITATVAGLYGMGKLYLGFNPLGLKHSDATRNTGFFGMVLNFAHNLAFLQLLFAFFLVKRKETQKYIKTPLLIFLFVANFVSLYTTLSRGALLAFIIAAPFIFFLKNIKKFILIVSAGAVVAGAIYFIPSLQIVRAGSDYERIAQWQTAVVAFKERPVLGMGYLNFEKMCPSLKVKYDIGEKQFCGHAHNNFLEMLASTGFVGFLFFSLWVIFWFVEMIKRKDLLGELMIPLIVVFFVGGMTQATFTLGANLFLIMGLYTVSMIEFKKGDL